MEAFRYNRVVQALLQEREGVEIIEGHLMPDHIHMLVSIPSKMSKKTILREAATYLDKCFILY